MLAELTKLRTLRVAWIAAAVAVLAGVALDVLAGVVRIGATPVGRVGIVALIPAYAVTAVAVLAAGSEYQGGQIRVSLVAAPRRSRLAAAKLAVTVAVCAGLSLVAVRPSPVAALLLSLIGYGLAVLARGVAVPLAVLVVLPVAVSPMLGALLPDVVRFLPHEAALSVAGLPGGTLSRTGGLVTLIAWAAVSLAAAGLAFTRRDS